MVGPRNVESTTSMRQGCIELNLVHCSHLSVGSTVLTKASMSHHFRSSHTLNTVSRICCAPLRTHGLSGDCTAADGFETGPLYQILGTHAPFVDFVKGSVSLCSADESRSARSGSEFPSILWGHAVRVLTGLSVTSSALSSAALTWS